MNFGPILYLGAFLSMALSFWGLVLSPQLQLGRQELREIQGKTDFYPYGRMGLAKAGADVYRSLGCAECHTQQVRPKGYGGDIERGWGIRRTVAQDYLRDDPVQLGSLRMGPDLANVGARQPNLQDQLLHLYHPKSLVSNSTMPPYPFLFEERAVGSAPSPDALKLTGDLAPVEGREIVPTDEARYLAAYLLSLKSEVALFEAPLPPPPPAPATNAPPADTNAPPAVPAKSSNQ